jgi:hypothetical protein
MLPLGIGWLAATHVRAGRTLTAQLGIGTGAALLGLGLWPFSAAMALGMWLAAGAILCLTILRSPLPQQVLAWLAYPRFQAGGVLFLALGVVGFGFYRIEAELSENLAESDALFSSLTREVDFQSTPSLMVQTDQGHTVELWTPTSDSIEDLQSFSEQEYLRRMRLEASLIQTGPADGVYNCHGWVFTGGRFWIRGQSVERILEDNGYQLTLKPMIGDLCIYRDRQGEVSHSAVVRGLGEKGVILLESKWGKLGRFIHMAHENHAYTGHVPSFYRSARSGHLLRGLPLSEQPVTHEDATEE